MVQKGRYNFTLDKALHVKAKVEARKDRRSLSSFINGLLENYFGRKGRNGDKRKAGSDK